MTKNKNMPWVGVRHPKQIVLALTLKESADARLFVGDISEGRCDARNLMLQSSRVCFFGALPPTHTRSALRYLRHDGLKRLSTIHADICASYPGLFHRVASKEHVERSPGREEEQTGERTADLTIPFAHLTLL